MRILLLILLLPLTLLAQTIDRWDVVRNGYYKVVVDGDTLQDNFTRYDTALKFAYDNASGGEVQIVPPSYDFNYSLKEYDTTNVENLTLRQVNMGYQRINGERALTYDAEAHGDSVLFEYFHNGQRLQKSLQHPKGGIVRDTLKDPPIDSIQVWVHGYWDKWVEPYHEIVDIAFLDTLGQDMALQDIPYVTASWTSPSSDLTDYVGYFDLSDAPQSWWDEVNTSDGTKLRVAKDDAAEGSTSATELAFDVQGFDDTAQEGHLWFRWSGTLASTSPNDIRIYPAKSGATSYSNTDTFGRNAVWANDLASYHMATTADASGNGNTLTETGTASVGGGTGKIGSAADIPDGGNYLSASDPLSDGNYTVRTWFNRDATGSNDWLIDNGDSTNGGFQLFVTSGDLVRFRIDDSGPNGGAVSGSTSIAADQWYMVHLVADKAGNATLYVNGSSEATLDISGYGDISGTLVSILYGIQDGEVNNIDGQLDETVLRQEALSADWISHEYDNQNNPSTFWSSITLDNTEGGEIITMDNGTFSLSGYDLYQNLSTPINDGSFTLSGYPLLQNLSIPLDNGSFTSNGYALSFGLSVPIDNGTVGLTGYDLIYNRSVPLDQGSISQSGYDLNLNLSIPLATDSFNLTGYELNFDEQATIVMGSGSFSVDGNDLSFQFTHPLDSGSYAVSGNDIHFNTSIPLQEATFNLDGKVLSFNQVLQLDNGEFAVTGYPMLFDAVENIVLLSGSSLITDIEGASTIKDLAGKSLITDIEGESTL